MILRYLIDFFFLEEYTTFPFVNDKFFLPVSGSYPIFGHFLHPVNSERWNDHQICSTLYCCWTNFTHNWRTRFILTLFDFWEHIIWTDNLLFFSIGRRRSRVNFLKFYMVISSVAVIVSSACALKDNPLLKVFIFLKYFLFSCSCTKISRSKSV